MSRKANHILLHIWLIWNIHDQRVTKLSMKPNETASHELPTTRSRIFGKTVLERILFARRMARAFSVNTSGGSTTVHSTATLRRGRFLWWEIRPPSPCVIIDVNSIKHSSPAEFLNISLTILLSLFETTAYTCTTEKVLFISQPPELDPRLLTNQMISLEKCWNIARHIAGRKLNRIWHALHAALIWRSTFLSTTCIMYEAERWRDCDD